MTAQNRAANKARFEQGDTPQGSDYADLVDSFVSLADTTTQSLTSDLQAPKFIATTEVSAPSLNAVQVSASSGSFVTVSANQVYASAFNGTDLTVTNLVAVDASVATLFATVVTANQVFVSALDATRVSAATVSANAVFTSAIGVTRASAATLIAASANMTVLDVLTTLRLDIATTASVDSGAVQVMPTAVSGYLIVNVAGTNRRIPFF